MKWYDRGACKGTDPDMWFPQQPGRIPHQPLLKKICDSCEVKSECKADVIAELISCSQFRDHKVGYRAGETERSLKIQATAIKRQLKKAKAA